MLAFQICQLETNKKMGLLPMKISRIPKLLIDTGAVFQAKLTSTHYCRSPFLVRGGPEISFEVTIKLTKDECTKALLEI